MSIEEEFEILVTRASEYVRCTEDSASSSTPVAQKKLSLLKRNSVYLKCEQHCLKTCDKTKGDTWTDVNTNCRSCIKFDSAGEFRNGILPRAKEVLECLLTTRVKHSGVHSFDHSREVAIKLKLHWIYCNVYPWTINSIKRHIDSMLKEYRYLCRIPNEKKKETYWKRYTNFVKEQSLMFDIIASPDNIKTQEELWGVKMVNDDRTFYENQKLTTPIGGCEAFAQRKWELSRKRALKRKERSRVESYDESFAYVKNTDVTDEQCDDMRC